jgi:hypothetical protein
MRTSKQTRLCVDAFRTGLSFYEANGLIIAEKPLLHMVSTTIDRTKASTAS